MTITRDAFLLSPYRPPTSYPVGLNPDEAAAWLSGFFALWHPAVLRHLSRPPQMGSSYDHDQPTEGAIYAVPEGPHLYQPDDWNDRLAAAGAVAVRATPNRAETLTNLLEQLHAEPVFHDNIVRAFAGVGYGYLIVETLFDAAEHDHLLDAEGFWTDVANAVRAAVELTDPLPHLRSAVDKLRVAREALNTSQLHFLDLAVPDPTNLEAPWPASLHRGRAITVITSGEVLRRLHDEHPAKFTEIKSRFAPGVTPTVDMVCGSYREREDVILPAESQWWNLAAGRKTVADLLGEPPAIYGRYRTALHSALPGWLTHAGFKQAVATNFDGALTPIRNAAIVNWPGPDGKTVDAFAQEPLPARDPLTFFNLACHLHTTITRHSTPVIALLHRGEAPAVGYDELLGLADLGDALGTFSSLSQFLSDHHYGEYIGAVAPDDFFTDYLDDRVTRLKRPDAVSGFARHLRSRRQLDGAFTLAALHRMLTPPTAADNEAVRELERLEKEVETIGADTGVDDDATRNGDVSDSMATFPLYPASFSLYASEVTWAHKLADRILARSLPGTPGLLVLNPCGFTRRVGLELDPFPVPIPVEGAVKAAQFDADKTRLVVEVPGLGFAWIPRPQRAAGFSPAAGKLRLKTAEGTTVRNEFFEAELDPATGALRAFRDTRTRINRLGLQLVFNPGSKMRATDVSVTLAGAAVGEVTATGELLDDHDAVLARFKHRIRAWVGRPALEVFLELEPVHQPTGYPWHAYFGARFAWRDDRATLFRGAQGLNAATSYTRPGSPDYLEVRLGSERTFIFTGGLPFAQRNGNRMADIILIPEGEQGRRFELLLAFDRDYPMATAAGWTAPTPVVSTDRGAPPVGPSGWLGHLDLPSLLLTSLRPDEPGGATPRPRAVTARFLECAGFGGSADLRFAKDPMQAAIIDGTGEEMQPITLAAGVVPLEFSASEVIRVRTEWT